MFGERMAKMIKILFIILLIVSNVYGGFIVNETCPMSDRRTGLIRIYHLDVNSATQIDSSTVGDNGTVTNAVYTATSKFGGAYYFDGAGDYITMAISTVPVNVSLSAWIYITAAPTEDKAIIAWGNNNGYRVTMMSISKPDGTNIVLGYYIYNYAAYRFWYSKTTHLSLNTWYHVVATQGTSTATTPSLFVNGVSQDVYLIASAGGTPATMGETMVLGRHGSGAFYYFKGNIDDAAVFNVRLSTAAVQAIYNEQVQENR